MTSAAAARALLHLASAVILLAALCSAAPHLGQYDDAGLEEVAAQVATFVPQGRAAHNSNCYFLFRWPPMPPPGGRE